MEPFTSGILAGALANLSAAATLNLFSSLKIDSRKNSDFPVVSFFVLPDSEGEGVPISEEQTYEVRDFLEAKEVSSLVSLYAVVYLSHGRNWDRSDSLERIRGAFIKLTANYCAERDFLWGELSPNIWECVTSYVAQALPSGQEIEEVLSSEDFAAFQEIVGVPAQLGGSPAIPAFIRELVEMTRDATRVKDIQIISTDIRRAAIDYYSELRMQHTQEDVRFSVADLYVERSLVKSGNDNEIVSSSHWLDPYKIHRRSVVIGNPGVGKSTLVGRTLYAISRHEESGLVPLMLRCREYVAGDSDTSILSALGASLSLDMSLDVEESVLRDILVTGRGFVVFDGVDEILDMAKRRDFIRRVEAFSRRFPLATILATSRRIGYSQANFSHDLFTLLELQEFSEDQVTDYAKKWFFLTKRSDVEREAFLRELHEVKDIRSNPLMLSLLCTLYGARGYIPHNRLSVYEECVDLLFKKWDRMRQIDQPYEHKKYGERLMQELAYFFYTSQKAQSGVEERQLRKIISVFFSDTSGTEEEVAKERAQIFLDFCADRAWLLTNIGTNRHGDRIFSFTHRTFMEYFAASAIVRRAADLDNIVSEVRKSYDNDPSSVLADVIVQGYEDKQERGAQHLVESLLSRGSSIFSKEDPNWAAGDKYTALTLRILNACPLNSSTMEKIFSRLFNQWSKGIVSRESCFAFFEVHKDPARHIAKLLDREREAGEFSMNLAFCIGFARYDQTDYSFLYRDLWFSIARNAFGYILENDIQVRDMPLIDYLAKEGRISAEDFYKFGHLTDYCATEFLGEWRAGVTLSCFLSPGAMDKTDSGIVLYQNQIGDHIADSPVVHPYIAEGIENVLSSVGAMFAAGHFPGASQLQNDRQFSNLNLWLACIFAEISHERMNSFFRVFGFGIDASLFVGCFASHCFRRGWNPPLEIVAGGRRVRVGRVPKFNALHNEISDYPSWFKKWVDGVSLIRKM